MSYRRMCQEPLRLTDFAPGRSPRLGAPRATPGRLTHSKARSPTPQDGSSAERLA